MKLISLLVFAFSLEGASFTIRNVNVIDVESGTLRKRVNVVVRGSAIASVGRLAQGAVIDGAGKFLIPGLWDMHVHLWDKQSMFGMYVANGVLGVRDMGSDPVRTRKWRADVEAGRAVGPRVYTPGSPVDAPSETQLKMPVVRVGNADEARRAVDLLDTQGADFIKVMSTLSRDAYFALAQRSRVIRAVFAGHVPEAVTISQALDARQKSMEHMFGLALACSSEEPDLRKARAEAVEKGDNAALAIIRLRTYQTFSESRATELFRKMARYDVWQTPTLVLRKRLSLLGLEELVAASQGKAVPKEIRATWDDPLADLRKATPDLLERFRRDYEFHAKLVSLMQRNGVGLLAGTDTGDPYVLPGYGLHDELELMVQAGLTPAQALRTATLNPARYFGIEALSGSIARGKRADLVLLDANPLEDISNIRRISRVFVRGAPLNRKQLDRMLTGALIKKKVSE